MTGPVVAMLDAHSPAEEDLLEFLRVVAALAACGHRVRLVVPNDHPSPLDAESRSDEVDRYVDALALVDVRPRGMDDAERRAALAECASVLRLGDPKRDGRPAVLAVDGATEAHALRAAGQVIRDLASTP